MSIKSGRYHMVRGGTRSLQCSCLHIPLTSSSLDGLDGVDSVGGWLGVDESTASCIGASLLLSSVNATTPGPNYDLLCDPDENDCSKSTWTVLPPRTPRISPTV